MILLALCMFSQVQHAVSLQPRMRPGTSLLFKDDDARMPC